MIDDCFGRFVCDTSQRLFKILLKFGLKRKTVLYCSRVSKFVNEFDYYYCMQQGKITDEGEKDKMVDRFQNISTDKSRHAENLGLGNQTMLLQTTKPGQNQIQDDCYFDLSKGIAEFNSLLYGWKILLILTIIIYIALVCGFSKIFMFRYFTLLLYQLGDSKDIEQILSYSVIFGILFTAFPLYEYIVKNILCRHISLQVHAKTVYRLLLTPARSIANTPTLTLKMSRDSTNFEALDEQFPEALTSIFYQLSFIIAIFVVLVIIGTYYLAISIVAILFVIFMAFKRGANRMSFIEMENYIHSKWLALNLDIFNGSSVVRACHYNLYFEMRLFDLEERKNMVRLYLIGQNYKTSLISFSIVCLLSVVPLLFNAYRQFTTDSHVPCIVIYYLFALYLPVIVQELIEGIRVASDTKTKVSKMLKDSKEKFDCSRKSEEQVIESLLNIKDEKESKKSEFEADPEFILEFDNLGLLAPIVLAPGSTIGKYLIDPFTMKIKPKEKIAIVSDKSTCVGLLSKLVLKMFDNYTGNLKFRGKLLPQLNSSSIRGSIFYLDQSCGIIAGSLGENLAPFLDGVLSKEYEIEAINMLENFGYEQDLFPSQKLDLVIDPNNITPSNRIIIGLTRCYIEFRILKPSVIIFDNIDSGFSIEIYTRLKYMIENEYRSATILMLCAVPKVACLMEKAFVFRMHALVEIGRLLDLEKNRESAYSDLVNKDLINK